MKDQFEKFKSRLSVEEKESLWQDVVEPRDLENERRVQFWRGLGIISSTVAAVLLFVLIWDFGPPDPSQFKDMTLDPGMEVADNSVMEEMRLDIEGSVSGNEKVAAPVESTQDPAVATSDQTHRVAAAAPERGEGDSETMAVIVLESEEDETLPAGSGRICGKVFNVETGEVLAFANIVVEGTTWGTMSQEDGTFCLTLPAGEYKLIASYMGYEPTEVADLRVGGDRIWRRNFAMKPTVALEMETFMVDGVAPNVDVKASEVRKSGRTKDLRLFAPDGKLEETPLEAPWQAGDIHLRGGRTKETNIVLDNLHEIKPDSRSQGQSAGETSSGHIQALSQTSVSGNEKKGRERSDLQQHGIVPGRDGDETLIRRRGHRRCWWPPEAEHNWPNREIYDAMFFEHYGVNPFIVTDEDALSTFAIDVDNASYTIMRRYVEDGNLPPSDAVRVEEYVNYFDQGYGPVKNGDFAIRFDGSPSPFRSGYHLLRVSVQGREIRERNRKPANLIFVVDTSGSMNRENRLGLVKRSLITLLDELRDDDTVGIVEYGSRGRVVLRPTSLENRREIEIAIRSLRSNGSTNAEEGLDLAYTMASRIEDPNVINRLILCSDGVANTGETQAERILANVRYQSDRGIYLSTIGFGMGNYNDVLMEKLADKGDGNYYYVDGIEEAERVFSENLSGTLQTIARDAKIQVEFDPENVLRYRLLGYENRDVADRDFRNDAVDAGEIGAGHTVTAIYELKLSDETAASLGGRGKRGRSTRGLQIGTARLRYEYPRHDRKHAGEVVEMEQAIGTKGFSRSFDGADAHFQLSNVVAQYAEILRGSYWAKDMSLAELADMAEEVTDNTRDDDVREFKRLLNRAARLDEPYYKADGRRRGR